MNLNDVQSRIFTEPAFRAYVNKTVVRACASVRAEVAAAGGAAHAAAAAVTAQVRRIAAARRDKPYAAAHPPRHALKAMCVDVLRP